MRNPPCVARSAAVIFVSFLLGSLSATPSAVRAQVSGTNWSLPYVTTVDLVLTHPEGGKGFSVPHDRTLVLSLDESWYLDVVARDQRGSHYSSERLVLGTDHDCDGVVEISSRGRTGRYLLESSNRTGECGISFWIPSNMNLDRLLVIRTVRPERTGYTAAEAEIVADRLFRALLGRSPDEGTSRRLAGSVARGDLEGVVTSLVGSDEFRRRSTELEPRELLDDIYRGLLGRPVPREREPELVSAVRAGRIPAIVLNAVTSDEFEAILVEEPSREPERRPTLVPRDDDRDRRPVDRRPD